MVIASSQPVGAAHGEAGQQEDRQPAREHDLVDRQRRALLRKNPHITDWANYLAKGGELVGI